MASFGRRLCFCCILAFLALAPGPLAAQAPGNPAAPPQLFPHVDTSFATAAGPRPARLRLPRGEGRFPALVVANGSGSLPHGDNRYDRFYAAYLEAGFAVLSYDDRTPGDARSSEFPAFAEDLVAALRHAKTLPQVDPARVGVIGYSRGGWTAPMAARLAPGEMAFMWDPLESTCRHASLSIL